MNFAWLSCVRLIFPVLTIFAHAKFSKFGGGIFWQQEPGASASAAANEQKLLGYLC